MVFSCPRPARRGPAPTPFPFQRRGFVAADVRSVVITSLLTCFWRVATWLSGVWWVVVAHSPLTFGGGSVGKVSVVHRRPRELRETCDAGLSYLRLPCLSSALSISSVDVKRFVWTNVQDYWCYSAAVFFKYNVQKVSI